jgi:hypothetical protein
MFPCRRSKLASGSRIPCRFENLGDLSADLSGNLSGDLSGELRNLSFIRTDAHLRKQDSYATDFRDSRVAPGRISQFVIS